MLLSRQSTQLILICAAFFVPVAVHAQNVDPGALIRLQMHATVGVLLDEIPLGALREEAAANALAKTTDFWLERAASQVALMKYRLVFRNNQNQGLGSRSAERRGPLPLPPESVWELALNGRAKRKNLDSHDFVVVNYRFATFILSDAQSPANVEPRLGRVGGSMSETFNLPADPQLLFERTGYVCMNENEFPPGSVFEENAKVFYDDTCTAQSKKCHVTVQPELSCAQALSQNSGRVEVGLEFARVAYDPRLASRVRVGAVRPKAADSADLAVVEEGLADSRAFLYRFFGPGTCELEEGVIGRFGWRRLLTFSAIVRNDGGRGIDLGDVSDPRNPYVASNAFEYSACHRHYHFSHYGTFTYYGAAGTKRAFCLEETDRYHNNENTPLTAKHQSCSNQGIGTGWGDEYHFGIPGQWVDVTDIDTRSAHELGFMANPDQFLCEGVPEFADGRLVFDPTSFTNAAGQIQTRARCKFLDTWNANNFASLPVSSAGGSFVTEECKRGQLGPKRNCGFSVDPQYKKQSCASDQEIRLGCRATSGKAALLRVCEVSKQLGAGVACTFTDAIANVMIDAQATPVRFHCPPMRDAAMLPDDSGILIPTPLPGAGAFSIYLAQPGTLAEQETTTATVACMSQ